MEQLTPSVEPAPSTRTVPPALELVLAFVNTRYGGERHPHREVETPEQLSSWLVAHGLLRADEPVTAGDFRRAIAVREALRTLLHAHSEPAGDAPAPAVETPRPPFAEAIELLNALGRTATLRVRFTPDGGAELEPDLAGVDGAFARLLSGVVLAMADGTWARLKACRNVSCGRAFYDVSKNHSATWCSMTVCGNRLNARRYRRRRTSQAE